MKIKNELIHTVNITNEFDEVVTITIDGADMIQINNIAQIFIEFQKLEKLELQETTDFDSLVKQIALVAEIMEGINDALDKTFGVEVREKAFRGSSSLTLYNSFFDQLSIELEKAGVKVKTYIKELRKKEIYNKGKTAKDTI